MGATKFEGPVYGAKSLLWTFGPYVDSHSTGASTGLLTANSIRVVPPYEDWFVTEAFLTTSTNSSVAAAHGVYLKTEGGSTTAILRANGQPSTNAATILSMVNAAGSTTWSTSAIATVTAGEYEGTYCPAGSTLRLVSSGVSVMGLTQVNVMGYIRYVNSTRSA
jgi:hypothetical protein